MSFLIKRARNYTKRDKIQRQHYINTLVNDEAVLGKVLSSNRLLIGPQQI